jgi:hypothetical protein
MFTIVDLINVVGVGKIKVQFLHKCLKRANLRKDKTTDVTFVTEEITPDDFMSKTPSHLGIIIWVPFEHISEDTKRRLGIIN